MVERDQPAASVSTDRINGRGRGPKTIRAMSITSADRRRGSGFVAVSQMPLRELIKR